MVVTINSQDNSGFIKLEIDPDWSDDVLLSVSMSYGGYNGEDGGFFVFKRALTDFTKQLRILEEKRSGSVTLVPVSGWPEGEEDFRLEIFSIDRLGHVAAKATLRNNTGKFDPLELSISLEIDAEKFGALVSEFEALISWG